MTRTSSGFRRVCGAYAALAMSRPTPWNAPGRLGRMANERLSLLQVHAHPDDEASKGAGTTAKYAAEGVHNVLVCCTGGEAGDILNPAVDTPEIRANLFDVRMAELAESVRVLG